MNKSRVSLIAKAVSRHLEMYPSSADTLEGIHLWWIDSDSLGASLSDTYQALRLLEKQQLIEHFDLGGRELWRKIRSYHTALCH